MDLTLKIITLSLTILFLSACNNSGEMEESDEQSENNNSNTEIASDVKAGSSNDKAVDSFRNEPSLNEPKYDGEELTLAVAGEFPEIRENNIHFEEIELESVLQINDENFDGILIMEEHLSKAANEEYRDVYEEIDVPILFVGTEAQAVPFMNLESEIPYEVQADRINDAGNFISALWYGEGWEENGVTTYNFAFPIENNEYQQDKTEEVFSAVFKMIEFHVR